MQIDQRGAKEKCSGTFENILIDNMVLNDARDNRRNLECGWVDVRKAYDSLSHVWIKRMLQIHRFPKRLTNIISNIIDSWNIRLMIPLENDYYMSDPIAMRNGVLQGDVICPNLYTLSKNPISWELSRFDGYLLSKPIGKKITHSLYIDDLKTYNKSREYQKEMMSHAKKIMKDAGLEWNVKKSKVLHIKRGIVDTSEGDLILNDGSVIKCLENEEVYKFLGIPENELQKVGNLVEDLKLMVKRRASIVWSSPLSDYNKVVATNVFVQSCVEYFMWTQSINITSLREMDESIRNVMNENKAKYQLQTNSSLYLPRGKGGRGLKSLEYTYKITKIKAAVKLIEDNDPKMKLVKEFDIVRKSKKRKSILNDAGKYSLQLFDAKFVITEEGHFTFEYKKNNTTETTSNYFTISKYLKENIIKNIEKDMLGTTWQGLLLKERMNDQQLKLNECFVWGSKWKDCPVDVINDIQSIYLQTVPTLTFKKHRGESINSTNCRLCNKGSESVRHILSQCELLLRSFYKNRHDHVFQYILFNFLVKHKLLTECPPWFSKKVIKPKYENDEMIVLWDIPEYNGYEDESEERIMRPDGKIILKKEKTIFILEQAVPWITNRETKFQEKEDKYKNVVRSIKLNFPDYKVEQITLIMDCLGGYSSTLSDNLSKLSFSKLEQNRIISGIQKITLYSSRSIINHFKILTNV